MAEKLIRNKIPEIAEANGNPLDKVRKADANEMRHLLFVKLKEESAEALVANDNEILEELADIVEVVRALAHLYGHDLGDVLLAGNRKADERGDFSDRLVWVIDG